MPRFWKARARQVGGLVARITFWSMIWVSLLLITTSVGLRLFFGKITIDQLIFNVISLRADGSVGGQLLWIAAFCIIVLPTLLTASLIVWSARQKRKPAPTGERPRHRFHRASQVTLATLTVTVMVFGTTAFATTVKLSDYMRAGDSTVDIGEYYVAPTITSASEKRNLVLIYLESVETGLGDTSVFRTDMLAPVKEATSGWAQVNGLRQYPGGGWTMAGIVATQCGIPLKGKIDAGGSEIIQELVAGLDSYLPGATCLGDILADHGYQNVYLGGADTTFAAKNVFLSDHGYDKVLGLTEWRDSGESDEYFRSDWGLSDARLFAHARTEVAALHAASERTGQPFNLTLLTLDTHEPVHVYESCRGDIDAENDMESVYLCSMSAVAEFVDYLDTEGYLQDTAVVIMGDHLKQIGTTSSFRDELEGLSDRTIFNRVWIPDAPALQPKRDNIDQLSMYPTLLEIAGFTVENGQAGVGVSAFRSTEPEGSASSLNRGTYRTVVQSRSSEFYKEVWK